MNEPFYLTDEQRMIRDLARKIASERVAPNAARYDEAEEYPEASIRALIEAGLYGIWVPEAYGGSAMGALALALVCEEIAAACASTGTQYLDQALGGIPIVLAGTDEQKKRFLPALATGERLAAYSLSEPGAGSDAAGLRTTAVRRGDHYVLNGAKQWCTNGDHADVICVFATVDPARRAKGITAFLVERDTPGFSVGKKEKKLGIRASPTVALHFSDCAVPIENRLGAEGEGFKLAMRTLDITRPATGALGLGIAQAALDAAVAYAKERQQFGQPIGAFQVAERLGGAPESALLGRATRVAAANAVLANATLAHGLDFDDTREDAIVHTGCVAVTTALAVGETVVASGRTMLEAVIAGVEVMCRVGLAVPGALHARHFHPTAIE